MSAPRSRRRGLPGLTVPAPTRQGTPRSLLRGSKDEYTNLELQVIDGRWPDDLRGHVFMSGIDVRPGVPAFLGEGLLYRLDLGARGVTVKSRMMRPPCYWADRALASSPSLSHHAFRDVGMVRVSPMLGARTMLNTAPVVAGDRLLITTDAGRPWEVDPETLELVAPLGALSDWRQAVPGPWLFPLLTTTAHPGVDPVTHEVFTVNWRRGAGPAMRPFTDLMRWQGDRCERWSLVDAADGSPIEITQSVHQMVLTRRHVILLDTAFVVELRQLLEQALAARLPLPADGFSWLKTRAQSDRCVFWVVRREDLRSGEAHVPARRFEITGESVHFSGDYDDADDQIHITVLHTPCQDISEWIRPHEAMMGGDEAPGSLVGMPMGASLQRGAVGLHTLDMRTGRVDSHHIEVDALTWGLAFLVQEQSSPERLRHAWFNAVGFNADAIASRLLDIYRGRMTEQALHDMPIREGRPSSLVHLDVQAKQLRGWSAPFGWQIVGFSHVPRQGQREPGGADGYLIASCISDGVASERGVSSGDEVWVFDASDVSRGPICRLGAPSLDMAFTLHAHWVPSLWRSARRSTVDVQAELSFGAIEAGFGWLAPEGSLRAAIAHKLGIGTTLRAMRELFAREVLPRLPLRGG